MTTKLGPRAAASRMAAIVADLADEVRDESHGFWDADGYYVQGKRIAEIMRSGTVYLAPGWHHIVPDNCVPVGISEGGYAKFTVSGLTGGFTSSKAHPKVPPVECMICAREHAEDEPHRW